MKRAALLFGVLLLAGCGQSSGPGNAGASAAPAPAATPRNAVDPAVIARGSEVYQKNCASCHGGMAQGAPGWQRPGPDGKYPAPPLNGSAHAWHHPQAALRMTIREGTAKLGGNMPAWKDKLSDQDIDAVIAWMQSVWPEELYQAWFAMDQKSRQGNSAMR
ncbi:MAG: c-type cytochrome [Bacteroidota bacterium]